MSVSCERIVAMVEREMISGAEELSHIAPRELRAALRQVYSYLVDDEGCVPDVKTIYISFTLNGEMVAAIYPRSSRLEIALALPEVHSSELLEDASHLTWRTLPLMLRVNDAVGLDEGFELIEEAVNRVRQGVHNVKRPTEFFIARRRTD